MLETKLWLTMACTMAATLFATVLIFVLIVSSFNTNAMPHPAPTKKVVAYSLYGSNPRYTDGALANADLMPRIYNGWEMWVYHDASVPQNIINTLKSKPHVRLISMDSNPIKTPMMWRFLVASDNSVARYVIRDIDSRLSARERAAVKEWENSPHLFHVMRDHPSHSAFAMSGGMWGGTYQAFPFMTSRIRRRGAGGAYLKDMNFLNDEVWPIAKTSVTQHDSFSCTKFGGGRPFPTKRIGDEHIGSVYINGKMRQGDVDILRNAGVNEKCEPRTEKNSCIQQNDIITNKRYIKMCDVAFKTRSRDDFKLPLAPNSIVCTSGDGAILEKFFKLDIQSPFTLVTIESDEAVPQNLEWLRHPHLKKWYGWNSNHPKINPIPIGLNEDSQLQPLINAKCTTPKIAKLLVNFKEDRPERQKLHRRVKDFPWVKVESYLQKYKLVSTLTEHYETISQYKWTLCPRGAGEDTHRLWESLYLGSIPVVLKSPLSPLYDGLPVIQLDSWDDLTLSVLEEASQGLTVDRSNAYFDKWEQKMRREEPLTAHIINVQSYAGSARRSGGSHRLVGKRLHKLIIGRLGNQLFQHASTQGIADLNGMSACSQGGEAAAFFDGTVDACTQPAPSQIVRENDKFARHNSFRFDGDTLLDGYLQSFKYFSPTLRDTLRFKHNVVAKSRAYLKPLSGRTTVGIHVRRGDLVVIQPAYFIRIPPAAYFQNVLAYFRTKYSDAQFVVASDDTDWCLKQPFFVANDVHVVTEKHQPAIDMAILAGCDHMAMTVGTFGWWAAYLGAGAKGGEVVYYDSEFNFNHPTVNNNVVLEDYYPKKWVAMGSTAQTLKHTTPVSEWERNLPQKQDKQHWCPSKDSEGWAFVQSLYAAKALEHVTTCNNIQRIGGAGDGGKQICLDNLRPTSAGRKCVVYSLGSRLDFSFEIDIVKRFGCQVHTFDCTVGTPAASQIPTGVSFHPWCIGGKNEIKTISSDLGHQGESGQYFTLTTIRDKLGHSAIDLLKMDIERHEFAVVASFNADNAPRQIAFETHLHNAYGMWGRPVSEAEWEAMWITLGALGYRVFAHEPNPHCFCCCEFSIARRQMPVVEPHWAASTSTCIQHIKKTGNELARFKLENGQEGKLYEHPERFSGEATIVELGAFSGRDIGVFFKKASDRNIRIDNMSFYLYEPAKTPFGILQSTYQNHPNVHTIQSGAGDHTGNFCVTGTGDGLATRERTKACVQRLPILDVADVLKPHKRVDLLHINCEGCEVPIVHRVLEKSVSRDLKKIDAIEVQFHPQHISEKDYCKVATRLYSYGYRLNYQYVWVWELWEKKRPSVLYVMNIPSGAKCHHRNNLKPLVCITTTPSNDPNTIFVDVEDSWNMLGKRMLAALPQLYKIPAEWYFKVDPDTSVWSERLETRLGTLPLNVQYVGQVYKSKGSANYASGGAGYGIRQSALHKFEPKQCRLIPNQHTNYEDATVGDCLQRHGVKVHQLDGLYGDTQPWEDRTFPNHVFPIVQGVPILSVHKYSTASREGRRG